MPAYQGGPQWWKADLANRAAQYVEAQEAHPAKGRFQKAACNVVD